MPDSITGLKKILVCVGPGPSAVEVLRAAWRRAQEEHAKLYAAYVEVPGRLLLSDSQREHVPDNLRFAEKLGAETLTLSGRNVAETLVRFANEKKIEIIIAGRPRGSRIKGLFSESPAEDLIRKSGTIEVRIVSGEPVEPAEIPYGVKSSGISWPDYGTAVLFLILATGLCFLMFPYFALTNLIMVYLLAVTLTAVECGRGPAVLNSVLSVLAFDFFFVPPRFSFAVSDAQYIVTFVVMCLVALAISHLTALMRKQTETARLQERQAAAMHGLSSRLASSRSAGHTLRTGVEYIGEIFKAPAVVFLPGADGRLAPEAGDVPSVFPQDFTKEFQLARKAFETGKATGLGTGEGQDGSVLYVPLAVADTRLGVFALRPEEPDRLRAPDQLHLLESLVKQVALSLEVELLAGSCDIKPVFPGIGRDERMPGAAES